MKWFLNLRVAGKLAVGFGTLIVLLVATAVVGWNAISGTRDRVRVVGAHDVTVVLNLAEWRVHLNAVRSDIREMVAASAAGDQAAIDSARNDLAERERQMADAIRALEGVSGPGDPLLARLPQLKAEGQAFMDAVHQELALLDAGKIPEVLALLTGTQAKRFVDLRDLARDIGAAANRQLDAEVGAIVEQSDEAIGIVVALGAAAVLLGFVIAFGIGRSISRPLGQASQTAARIAEGDLRGDPPKLDRRDEVGELARNFGTMAARLREMTRDIREGVTVLSSAAQEISATTSQISAGASETAVAVTQTTVTLGETRQTTTVATQKAQQVADVAQQTAQTAAQGRRAVEQTVEGMRQIRAQMDGLAQSILRLSEQSQTVGEITATVQDLAEQSNLLAVNAAIEAAKAGDAGRGFAVVAQEVKSLAEQSRQATAQIRAILADNQKATGAAVMATEQCGKTIEAGTHQSQEAGESIRMLGDAVGRAAEVATQIAATSKQQLVGMDQVSQAMENINKASQQNVAATGQAAQAAHNVFELGEKLRGLVERFRL